PARVARSLRRRRDDARQSVLLRPAPPVALVRRRARGAADDAVAALPASLRPEGLSARRAPPALHLQSAVSADDPADAAPVPSGARTRAARTDRVAPGLPALRRLATPLAPAATEPGGPGDARRRGTRESGDAPDPAPHRRPAVAARGDVARVAD